MPFMKRRVACASLWGYLAWYVLSLSAQVTGIDAIVAAGPWVGVAVALSVGNPLRSALPPAARALFR